MAGRLIGEAYISILPQTDAFGAQTEAEVKKALAALKPTVDLRPVLNKAGLGAAEAQLKGVTDNVDLGVTIDQAKLASLKASIDAYLKNQTADIGVSISPVQLAAVKAGLDSVLNSGSMKIDTKAAVSSLTALRATVAELSGKLSGLRADVDDTAAEAQVAALQVKAEALDKALAKAGQNGATDFAPFEARMLAIQAAFEKISAARISLSDTAAVSALTGLARQAADLRAALDTFSVNVNDTAALAKIAALQAQAAALSRSLVLAPASADLAPFRAQLLGIAAAYDKLTAAQAAESGELKNQVDLWGQLGLAGPGSLIHITDILNASLPPMKLFGGALGMMFKSVTGNELPVFASHLVNVATSAHLTTEAAIEFAAIWGPAAIALTTFSAAAVPAVIAVYKQLVNMNTAAQATGQQFKSLATSSASVTAAVRPTVLEAFGIALYAVQNHSSNLAAAMHSLGQGIDQFAAKAAVAFDSKQAGTFFTQASNDALGLMNSFEQLGSIVGTLIKVVPGYAEVLLNFGNAGLTAAASVTRAMEPVIAIFLRLHGAILYGGLAGTAAAFGFSKIVSGATTAAEAMGAWAASNLAADSKVTEGIGKVLLGLDSLSGGPVLAGIALVAGAIAGIVIYLKASKSAADSFNSSIQSLVKNSSLSNLQSTLAAGITQTSAKYVDALKQVDAAHAVTAGGAANMQFHFTGINTAVQAATQAAGTYKAGLSQLTGQQQNVNDNLSQLAKQFGTTIPGALALANTAQITSNQLTASGASNYNTMAAQIGGAVAELKVMTAGTGTLNQALNALTVTQSSQLTSVQKVTGAWSTWIGIVTGGDSQFASFEQGLSTLTDEMAKGAAAGVKLTTTSGKLREDQILLGTALLGTSTSALAARQAFDSQVVSATQLYGTLQTMATASGNTAAAQVALTKAGRDLVAQLLPLAKGSQQATAEVYALAQIAGYGGVDSFQGLTRWLGNTRNAESDLNTQQTILTLTTANLTAAAKNLSNAVGQQVTEAEAQAIAKTANFQQATLNLSQAFNTSNGTASQLVQLYAGQFYESLIKAGTGADSARQQVDAFLTQLGATPGVVGTVNNALAKLPKNTQLNVTMSGNGYYTITENGQSFSISQGGLNSPHAAGGYISAGTGPTADDVPIRVSKGEYVVKAASVAKYGTGMMHAINEGKFASGGPVGSASVTALGPFATHMYSDFQSRFAASMVSAMTSALKSSEAAALAAAAAAGNAGAYQSTVIQVMKLLSIPMSDLAAIMRQMNTESGGNPTAVNKTDINAQNGTPSTGLMQVIAPTFDAYAGPFRNTGPFLNGVSVNPEANIYAGLNYAIHRYGMANLGSVLGQGHGYSAGGMVSEPVYGVGAYSHQPYSFAERGSEYVGPLSGAPGGGGMGGMNAYQAGRVIQLLEHQNRLLAQMPYSQAQALNQASATGVRRGYFATSG